MIKELRSRAEKIVEDDGTIRKSLEQYMQKCVDLVEDRHGSENKSVENVLTKLVSNENSDLMSSQLKNANETISVMVRCAQCIKYILVFFVNNRHTSTYTGRAN